jgi:carbonic anhydrase/acetyltransferase-like protein (isoleucine patch superfamily)
MTNIRPFNDQQPNIGKACYIDAQATVIGDVTLGDDCSVWPQAVIRGDVHSINIGAQTSVQDGAVLHVTHKGPFNPEGQSLTIGNKVTIGHNVTLHGCTIGELCLIGMGAIVMDGAVVGDKVIIGAGSLVPPNTELESGCLYVGSPVKKVRALNEKELSFLPYSAEQYVKLKNQYL